MRQTQGHVRYKQPCVFVLYLDWARATEPSSDQAARPHPTARKQPFGGQVWSPLCVYFFWLQAVLGRLFLILEDRMLLYHIFFLLL